MAAAQGSLCSSPPKAMKQRNIGSDTSREQSASGEDLKNSPAGYSSAHWARHDRDVWLLIFLLAILQVDEEEHHMKQM